MGPGALQFASKLTCPDVYPGEMFGQVFSKALQKWQLIFLVFIACMD